MLQKLQRDQNRQEHTKKKRNKHRANCKTYSYQRISAKTSHQHQQQKENNDRTVVTPTSSLVTQPPEN